MSIAVVQEKAFVVDDSAAAQVAFDGNVTVGSLITVVASRYAAGGDTAFTSANCSKAAGTATIGTVSLDKQSKVATTNPNQSGVWSVIVTGAGSLTMQVTGPAGSYFSGAIGEYSGVDTSSSRVESTNANTATTATSPATTGNVTTAGEALLIACASLDAVGDPVLNPVIGNSFTSLFVEQDSTSHQCGAGGRRIVTSGTTTQGTWTLHTPELQGWSACVVAYKAASTSSDVELTLGVGNVSVTGHAPTLAVTGDVTLALGTGAVSATGYAPTLDDGTPVTAASGLDFPGVDGEGDEADWLMFGWANGDGGSGIDTDTPPLDIYPATYIWRVFPRNGSQKFWSGLFHAEDWPNNTWDALIYDYYGFHPYHNPDVMGPGDPRWEISAFGGDETFYRNGDPATIAFGSYPPTLDSDEGWYTQVATARVVGENYEYTFYTQWPDTSTATTIRVTQPVSGPAPHPILCVGDAPWNRGKEIYKGILRGFQFYDDFLSTSEIADEIAEPGSVQTPWYLNLNPTPNDISDKSGNGHDPAWVNSNRPALWAVAADVDLSLGTGAVTATGFAPTLVVSDTVDLTLGTGAAAVTGYAPTLTIQSPMPPVAAFSVAVEDQTVTVTDRSTDADGEIVGWAWDWGDESTDDVQSPDPHEYAEPGTYTITLTVTDDDDLTSEKTRTVTVPPASAGASRSTLSLGMGLGL